MTMLLGTESHGPGSVGVGRVSVGRVTAFECSCWSSVGGLCWADVSQEEQLSQTAERARSWEGGAQSWCGHSQGRGCWSWKGREGELGGSLGVLAAASAT